MSNNPAAYLVTDIHGQKKALRAGAEGIERHRNAGSELVPLFDPKSLVITLPEMPKAQRTDEEATFSAGGCDMLRRCRKAIEAAGLKVAP